MRQSTLKQTLCFLFLFPSLCFGWEGKVTKVHDGDSIWVMKGDEKVVVRLLGIDAPEIKQAHGIESRDYLRILVLDKLVKVSGDKKDKYDRTLATIYWQGHDVNLLMLEKGRAWHYRPYKNERYEKEEIFARKAEIGLWKGDPIPPWEFRKQN